MPKITETAGPSKPKKPSAKKPRADFPLFPHATSRWAKKVRGRFVYFGKVDADPKGEAALLLWLDQKDDLLAGRTPRVSTEGVTVSALVNRFLTAKRQLVDSNELTERSWKDYHNTCKRVVDVFGRNRLVDDLAVADFEMLRATIAKTCGPVTLGNEITRIRVLFKYSYDAGIIDRPVRYGPGFKKPSKKTLRLDRQAKGARMLEANEVRSLMPLARQPVKAMVLLAINAGLGNSDIGQLEHRHLDLKAGWLDFPRPKTGVERRAKLWPETIQAINDAIKGRPEPLHPADDRLVFLTRRRMSWAKGTKANPLSREFANLAKDAGVLRPGVSFYSLRHVFRTIADETHDQPAIDHIMGHARDDMASVYRERIGDDRLKAISDHVRRWLFPNPRKPK